MILDFLSNTALSEAREKTFGHDSFLEQIHEQKNKEIIMPAETVKLDFRSILADIEKPFKHEMYKRYLNAVKSSNPVDTFISYLNILLSSYGFDNVSCSFLYHDITKGKEEWFLRPFQLNVPNVYKDIKSAYFELPSVEIAFFGIKGIDINIPRSTFYEKFKVKLYDNIYLLLKTYPFEAETHDDIRCELEIGGDEDDFVTYDLQLKKRQISLAKVVDKSNEKELVDNFKSSTSAAIRDELNKQVPENIEIPKEAIWNLAKQVFDYFEEIGIIEIDLF